MDPSTPLPSNHPPTPIFLRILAWIQHHKKVTFALIAGFFLILIILTVLFPQVRQLITNENQSGSKSNKTNQDPKLSSITIKTDKNSYAVNENIVVTISANSSGQVIQAFDLIMSYDPQFTTLGKQRKNFRDDFYYFGTHTPKQVRIAAVQKESTSQDIVFENEPLIELQFKAVKAGKATFSMDVTPETTFDSNLLNKENKDILGFGIKKEIEIK